MVTIIQKLRTNMKETIDGLRHTHTLLVEKLDGGKVPTKQEVVFLKMYPNLMFTYMLVQSHLRQVPINSKFKDKTQDFYELVEKLNAM